MFWKIITVFFFLSYYFFVLSIIFLVFAIYKCISTKLLGKFLFWTGQNFSSDKIFRYFCPTFFCPIRWFPHLHLQSCLLDSFTLVFVSFRLVSTRFNVVIPFTLAYESFRLVYSCLDSFRCVYSFWVNVFCVCHYLKGPKLRIIIQFFLLNHQKTSDFLTNCHF